MTERASRSNQRRLTAVLTIGFLALALAVRAARTDPATGWELSIYRATPIAFWIGVLVATVAAALTALHAREGSHLRKLALLLGPLGVVSVVALPVVRGYYFFGAGDALSYLGWTRLIEDGGLNPVEFLYPGIHSVAIFTSHASGLPLRRTLMTVPTVFAAGFVAFVALAVGRIASTRRGVVAGAFAATLLLPVNNISTFLLPYPTLEAIFFAPIVFYLLFRYVTDGGELAGVSDRLALTPFGILFVLASVATVLYHPQIGSALIAILVAILGVQLLAPRLQSRVGRLELAEHRTIAFPTVLVGAFAALWTPRFDRAHGALQGVLEGMRSRIFGAESSGNVSQQGDSLTELGGSLLEVFLKLFGVSLLLSMVAGVVLLLAVARRLGDDPDRNALLTYLAVGFVPLLGLFALFFGAGITSLSFRYLGFVMLLVTIVVAVAFADGLPVGGTSLSPPTSLPTPTRKTLAVAVFVLLLTPQLLLVFHSPHIYQASSQVTQQQYEGYETAFEHRDADVQFAGLRTGPVRYVDAIYGTTTDDTTPDGQVFEGRNEGIPFEVFGNNATSHYDACRYVALDDANYEREVTLYDGLRYDEADFASMETTPAIHRVQSNGEHRLYLIAADRGCTA